MALAVFNNHDIPIVLSSYKYFKYVRVNILMWTSFIVIMTILLNGTTTGYFVKLFGLS